MSAPPKQSSAGSKVLGRSGLACLGAALLLLLALAGASVWQSEQNSHALALARATRLQLNLVSSIMLTVEDGETSQRGFLLTMDPDYLTPLNDAARSLPKLLDDLNTARPTDPRIPVFRETVQRKLAELQHTVVLARSGDIAAAMTIVRTNAGQADMTQIRDTVRVLEREMDVALLTQVADVTRGGRRLVAFDVAGLVMVLALSGLIALTVRGYLETVREAQALTEQANEVLARSNERLDETVRSRTADLTAANEEIQQFAYIVSHDLRAPLVNIMGFTSELEQAANTLTQRLDLETGDADLREAVQDDIPEALRFIRSSTSKMDRLINAVLKLSREGRRVLMSEPLPMAAMLAAMADSMQHQASTKGAVIELGSIPDIVGDRLAVDQVFTNVIDNALKYLQPGRAGVIRITGEPAGAITRYEVTDNGRGIAERDYERVFELFRRAGDQTTPGEGIGLAHVRALVRRMGGNIMCRSVLGVGTTFTVVLPTDGQKIVESAA